MFFFPPSARVEAPVSPPTPPAPPIRLSLFNAGLSPSLSLTRLSRHIVRPLRRTSSGCRRPPGIAAFISTAYTLCYLSGCVKMQRCDFTSHPLHGNFVCAKGTPPPPPPPLAASIPGGSLRGYCRGTYGRLILQCWTKIRSCFCFARCRFPRLSGWQEIPFCHCVGSVLPAAPVH